MDPLQATILGFIQGVTEWLPVSSTGHLRIAEHFFGLTVPLLFDVILHFGTLIVILLFFRKDIKNILEALVKGDFKSENGKLIPLIIVGTVPTILIGFFLGNTLDTYFSSLPALGGGFIVCAVALYASKFGTERKENITYIEALLIGTAQGVAIIPSISRSGMTIVVAVGFGVLEVRLDEWQHRRMGQSQGSCFIGRGELWTGYFRRHKSLQGIRRTTLRFSFGGSLRPFVQLSQNSSYGDSLLEE